MKQLFSAIWFAQFFFPNAGIAQNYHAIQGSSYAGSLGIQNNPASMVNTPFKWDFTLVGAQLKSSTNAFTLANYSLLSSPANSAYYINEGQYKRQANLNFNLNLFNTRIALSRKHGIAFGINLRSHSNLSSSEYNFIDSLKNAGDFFKQNQNNNTLSGDFTSSSWVEIFGSYSRTLIDNESGRLNAGISLKLSRGISGAYAHLRNGQFSTSSQNNVPLYTIKNINLQYGYSSNYDQWQKGNSNSDNINNFFAFTQSGASLDIGFEYLVKTQEIAAYAEDDGYYDYDWKFGFSLLDVGGNQFKYGLQSRVLTSVQGNTTNLTLDAKFDSTVHALKIFNDSLNTFANQLGGMGGKFNIVNPMRMVINVDRFIYGAFFVNAELSLNMPNSFFKNYQQVKELNLITVTPRWETKKWGIYLPIQYNTQNQFWIGGAFKAGPLLIGIHNWSNLFSKSKMQNGGGYVALTFRAPGSSEKKKDKKLDCPPSTR